VDNRKRIRELTDEAIALADDPSLCQAERYLRIKTRERAVRALLQAEKQAHLTPKTLIALAESTADWWEDADA
jgi:hypothetical protein